MKVLYVASECAPFVKTGGLADVVGAVPKELEKLGAEVHILLPLYPALAEVAAHGKAVHRTENLFGGEARIFVVQAHGLNLLLLDAPHLFNRSGNIYLNSDGQDWHDNHLRFGGLCEAAAAIAVNGISGWKPDIVHAHDWHAGLVPLFIKLRKSSSAPKCVLTIHNIAFQGLFDASAKQTFGIPDRYFTLDSAEFWGHLGFLKAGLAFCDQITTVSPTYSRELLTPEFGMGLEGVLQARRDDLTGILNGIDLDQWNPKTDPELVINYTTRSLGRKAKNKKALEDRFGLDQGQSGPLFCVISRLTTQKGLDLLLDALPDLVERGAQLALLGSGDPSMEEGFRRAAETYSGQVGVEIGYDEALSHLMQGGSDAILIPSRFEPCGLTQLYGLRYGTLPVVARTGGLADTVVDAHEKTIKSKRATGIQFEPVTVDALRDALHRTCDLFENPPVWRKIVLNAMKQPVGWDQSAPIYLSLYEGLASR